MSLPFDKTKRTRQKMAHTIMAVPARSRTPTSPSCVKRRDDEEIATSREAPPEAAGKGPGAGNAAEA